VDPLQCRGAQQEGGRLDLCNLLCGMVGKRLKVHIPYYYIFCPSFFSSFQFHLTTYISG